VCGTCKAVVNLTCEDTMYALYLEVLHCERTTCSRAFQLQSGCSVKSKWSSQSVLTTMQRVIAKTLEDP
jgi:hypothetical protein